MGQREDLARQLGERVARYRDTGEARYVVGLDTLAQAAALLRLTVAHEADDKAAAHRRRFRRRRARDRSWETLAEVFWCRFAARPDSDEGLTDVATALDVVTGPLTHGDLERMPDYLVAGLALHQTRLTAYAAGDDGGFEERMVRAAAVLRTPPSACSREALRQAADDYRHVLRYASMRSPDYAELLADTGTALMMLFGGEQDGSLLDEAERLRRRRLAVEARGGDGRARALTDLIACLRRRWEHQQDPSVLRECAALGGELADSPPDAPGVRMTTLFWSGQVLHNLAAASGDTEVSVRALQLLRAAAETAESQHDLYAHVSIAYELSCALLGQYRAGHGLPALREAYDQAVVATALGVHPDLAAFYAHRMVVGRELAAATGDVPLMREAADLGRSALSVSSCQDDDPNRPLIHGEFSTTLHALYALTGDIDVLQHAVVAARDCEAAHPPDDPRRPAALGLLCELLMEQYAAQPNGTTLGEALHAARQAVDACPPGNPHRPRCLLRLSKALFLLTVPDALDEAVELAEEAAREMPLDHPERPLALAQLAACLTRSFELGAGDTMARVVEVTRDALRALPRDAPERAGVLVNLSSALRIRARQDTGIRVLEEAAEIAREAVAAAPGNAYTHAVLGFALQDRYEREPSSTVLRGARQAFAAAVETDGLPAAVRLKAYRALAWSHMASEDPASALAACERAVDLLPGIASMVLWHRDRRRALLGTAGLASEAASAAVAAGRPDRAVELLERARGTVLTETMDRRGMLAVLAGRDRELAGRYDDLLQEVEFFDTDPDGLAILAVPGQLGGPDPMPRAGGREAGFDFDGPSREQLLSMLARIQARRQELSALWEQLLGRIRRLDGFEDFMRPLSAEELRREAADGPIVLVNASRYRGDALIVSTDAIRSVPLDGVDRDTVVRQVDRLYAALASVPTRCVSAGVASKRSPNCWAGSGTASPTRSSKRSAAPAALPTTSRRTAHRPASGGVRSARPLLCRCTPRAITRRAGRRPAVRGPCWTGWSPPTHPRSEHCAMLVRNGHACFGSRGPCRDRTRKRRPNGPDGQVRWSSPFRRSRARRVRRCTASSRKPVACVRSSRTPYCSVAQPPTSARSRRRCRTTVSSTSPATASPTGATPTPAPSCCTTTRTIPSPWPTWRDAICPEPPSPTSRRATRPAVTPRDSTTRPSTSRLRSSSPATGG